MPTNSKQAMNQLMYTESPEPRVMLKLFCDT